MKDVDIKSRIINILSSITSTAVIQKCIDALERTPLVRMSTETLVNTKEILNIYRTRVQVHKSLNLGVIEGGDDLVSALEKESGEQVRIDGFRTDKEDFLIFMDPKLERLIGCISVHDSNEGQY
jgi:hypothetical protein